MRRAWISGACLAVAAALAGAAPAVAVPPVAVNPVDVLTPEPAAEPVGAAVSPRADGPTADELRDRVADCEEQVSRGRYAERSGQSRDIPVCATGDAVHWKSGITIDCDGQRTDECNESTDPWFRPETAWNQSDGQPLIASQLPFIVVPTPTSDNWDYNGDSGIVGGTVVAVVYEDTVVYGVVGDVGPPGQIGEASYAMADALGINPDPRSGGVAGKVVDYIVFPGVEATPIEDNAQAVDLASTAATALVENRPSCTNQALNFAAYPELASGAEGAQVRAVQCLLERAGFAEWDEGPTEVFDTATEDAVAAFQEDVGLEASGAVDAATWTALLSSGSTPTLREGTRGPDVSRLQRALTAALDREVGIDAIFGPRTKSAVEDYQRSRSLGVDGVVGANTWGALQAGR